MDHVADFLFSLLLDKFLINYLWRTGDWKLGLLIFFQVVANGEWETIDQGRWIVDKDSEDYLLMICDYFRIFGSSSGFEVE